MLPGNVPIYEWIDDLLKRKQNFKLAYFDLNNFKPYNDVYGYTRGDDVVAIFQSEDWKERREKMLMSFSGEVKYFYKEIDIKK